MPVHSKTWWGSEFMEALERVMDTGRLQRGRSYAQAHRRKTFKIANGTISATIVGNRNPYFGVYTTPYYDVKIQFEKIKPAVWKRVLKRLGTNADWVTHLVLGEVPPTIEDALADSKVKLLPRTRSEIQASCSCPDYVPTCKHIAGVHFYVASLLDRNPLLLFEFRGMPRDKLREALANTTFGAALLSDESEREPDLGDSLRESQFPAVPSVPAEQAVPDLRSFWRGSPVPRDTPEDRNAPPAPALLLRRAGDYPEFWLRENSFIETMAEVYERVAAKLPSSSSADPPIDMSR